MKTFEICVTFLEENEMHYDDAQIWDPDTTVIPIEAEDEEKALDIFHETYPIKILEDFSIDVSEKITRTEDMLIRCAAIRYDGKIFIGDAHATIGIYMVQHELCPRPYPSGDNQGFVTECGKYVRRKPALAIALMNGQVTEEDLHCNGRLYSEDLRFKGGGCVTREEYIPQETLELSEQDIEIMQMREKARLSPVPTKVAEYMRLNMREDGFERRINPPIKENDERPNNKV